ncbi:MAG: asparagine synthase (glutamine-hydrolyzing), partial [Planctomycetaceae bacterium]
MPGDAMRPTARRRNGFARHDARAPPPAGCPSPFRRSRSDRPRHPRVDAILSGSQGGGCHEDSVRILPFGNAMGHRLFAPRWSRNLRAVGRVSAQGGVARWTACASRCATRLTKTPANLSMCGICGIIASEPASIEAGTRSMMRAMVHRGPDDEGFELLPLGEGESGPFAGLGFRRLSILDLSPAGHQPMFHPHTGDCLVYNGELYNFRSLRAELQANGVRFHSSGDTEVVLKALSTWGDAALSRFQGMFSLAFYQAASRRILLARDALGIKPLYMATLPDRVVFASEVRTLLDSGLVPREPDVAGIAGMLAYGAVQAPRTAFAAIRSFPAGSSQWIDAGSVSGRRPAPPRRYWQFPGRRQEMVDAETAAAEVRQRLHDAVLRHLVADVPVGVFLSAGIDSTIVMALAREYTPRVKAFTVGFGSIHGQDEVPIAASTARALGVEHVAMELDASNMPHKWHEWLATMDSPSIDGFNSYVISRRLAEEGVTVGLSGLGADELFGGYQQFSRAPQLSGLLRTLA